MTLSHANDGRVDVPHLVSASRAKADLGFRRMRAEPGAPPAVLPDEAVPGGGRGPDLAEPPGEDRERAGRDMTIFGRGDQVLDRPETGIRGDRRTDHQAHTRVADGTRRGTDSPRHVGIVGLLATGGYSRARSTARRIRILGASIRQTLSGEPKPEVRSRASARWSSAVSFWTLRRSFRSSRRSSGSEHGYAQHLK